jgi:hypothetical protein
MSYNYIIKNLNKKYLIPYPNGYPGYYPYFRNHNILIKL